MDAEVTTYMNNQIDLTEGNILNKLVKLALPIMGTSFIQMSYNLVNMIYLGRVSSSAVAAIGTAGFFTWLANAFIFIPKTGAEIGISQSIGRQNTKDLKGYIKNTIQLDVIIGFIYGLVMIVLNKQLIGFFNMTNVYVVNMAEAYLLIISLGINFYFITPVFTGIFNGYGDSKTPFKINTIGIIINMIIDPFLIFGIGPFPRLEVVGAAIGTVISQAVATVLFIYKIKKGTKLLDDISLFKKLDMFYVKNIFKLGTPVALQNGLFCIFAMVIARIIASFGEIPIAVQKVGSQIEAISWMTAGGFSTAISAFVGQNYGARKWDRIYKGYFTALFAVSVIGVFSTLLLVFGAKPLFALFIPDEKVIPFGVDYLKILGYSQLFMCIEISTAGAFNGIGRTIPPSLNGIILTGLRIPAAIILSKPNLLGLNGVWWSISLSSVLKGIVLTIWFIIVLKAKRIRVSNI
ncbi:MAG: efflux family protein [Clostridiaceae bacterium]|jgi:putative MATE family efflux protein|nr:efflux family protein [Clostridiaceae bacterium]